MLVRPFENDGRPRNAQPTRFVDAVRWMWGGRGGVKTGEREREREREIWEQGPWEIKLQVEYTGIILGSPVLASLRKDGIRYA